VTSQAWLLPALPLAAALLGLLVPFGARRLAAALAVLPTAASTVLAIVLFAQVEPHAGRVSETSALLAPFGDIKVTLGTRVDGTAATVALMVCVVALAVQVYSTAYLSGDERYPRYAAQVSLFTAAMLGVVLAADLVVLLVGWEVMGICSYLLIGHYRDLPEAPAAAVKAFLVTRVGDIGFWLGVILLGASAHSFRIAAVTQHPHAVAALALLAGAAGKSAQFPLHTWLPDAMAGPTPISALIHAATMVAAGVYVVARLYPVFPPSVLAVIAVMASVTMLLGALGALGQDDLKRVLAYSTVSQLAYMFGGLAVGGVAAGMFHLLTHAAFKALLFLAAGAVLHGAGTGLMSRLGGLRRSMPVTCGVMIAGGAALAGLPPFAGAFSKDAVLDAAWTTARHAHAGGPAAWTGWLVYLSGLLTAVLTAAYVTRMILRTFFGTPRDETVHAHEPPAAMSVPVLVLVVPTVGLGFAWPVVRDWMPNPGEVHVAGAQTALTTVLVLAAGWVAYAFWRRGADPTAVPVLRHAFFLDTAYRYAVVVPAVATARAILAADTVAVDGAVEGSGTGSRWLGRTLARLQAGNVQLYATGILAAAVLLALAAAVTS
jgi:NADH-quinone oxidoreductase subunit L